MNDLLNVIIDLSFDTMKAINPILLMQDIGTFLSCYQLQSSLNNFRVYVSLPGSSLLLFPIDDDVNVYIKRLALADLTKVLIQRLEKVVMGEADVFFSELQIDDKQPVTRMKKDSSIATAIMKAVCYSRTWIEEVTVQKGEQFSARILIIKGPSEDPTQHTPIVNSIFACLKLKVTIDSLIFKMGPRQEEEKNSNLVKQAAFLTNGTTFTIADQSNTLSTLVEVFLSSINVRTKLKLPIAEPAATFVMSSTCSKCSAHTNLGYACSYCLSLYCATTRCHLIAKCVRCDKALSTERLQ